MDKTETLKILSVLKAAYPHSYKGMSQRDADAMVNLWTLMFADTAYEAVNAAVCALISTRTVGFSPTVGEVKEKLQSLRNAAALSEQDAWALVSKACSNGLYGYRKEFDRLPPEVQQAVGAPEQLREWARVDVETFQTVVASNFMRTFRANAVRQKEFAMLPSEVQQMVSGLAYSFKMIGGEVSERTV